MKKYFFFLFALLIMSDVIHAHTFSLVSSTGQTLYYTISGNNVTVTYPGDTYGYSSYTKPTGDLVIPSYVTYGGTTYSVASIGASAFRDCSGLTSVTIPNLVTSIGGSAFYGCSGLTSVTIPNLVTSIGDDAFNGCSGLTSVTIPNSVTSIGGSAFSGCSGLTSVDIPNSVTSIGNYAFSGCSGLTSVDIPNSVTSIGNYAFSGCSGLTSITVASGNRGYDSRNGCNAIIETATNKMIAGCMNTTIPNSVTSIGGRAFYGCTGLTSVTIPNSVTSIGGYAFAYSGLTSVTIPNSMTSIGDNAFSGCSGLTSVTIPNSVTSIGAFAFSGCIGLTSVTIPNSVTSIGDDAFYGCTGLTSVTIPNSVTRIGDCAFKGCAGLTSVTIGNMVQSIGHYVFKDCISLVTVNFNATQCYWMGGVEDDPSHSSAPNIIVHTYPVFDNCTNLTVLNIGENVTRIPPVAFAHCSGLTNVTIPNSVTYIGDSSFKDCTGLTSVTIGIGNSVTRIGYKAFFGCTGLTSVTIGNSVTSIRDEAFFGCYRLTSVTIPNSVTSIGTNAFYMVRNVINEGSVSGCPWGGNTCNGYLVDSLIYSDTSRRHLVGSIPTITTAIIPNSVTSIGNLAFYACSGLTSVTIPNSVTSIGGGAFYGCSGLTSVTIPNSVTSIGGGAFKGCSGLRTVNYNAINCSYMGSSDVFSGCVNVDTLNIGEHVSSILDNAFVRLTGLKTINYNAINCNCSIHDIGTLRTLNVGESVITIPKYFCMNCSTLTSVTIGNSVTFIGDSAFCDCFSLTRVRMLPVNPPYLGFRTFFYSSYYRVYSSDTNRYTFHRVYEIPCGCLQAYLNADHYSWTDLSVYSSPAHLFIVVGRNTIKSSLMEITNLLVHVSSNDEGMGSAEVTIAPTCADSSAVITATASEGYRFDHWSNGCTDNPYSFTLVSDTSLVAFFIPLNQYTVSVQPNDISMGSVTGGGTYWEQSTATLTAIPLAGYVFLQWQDGNTDNPRTVVVSSDSSFTAQFIASITLTANVNNSDMGSVTGSGTYIQGDTVIMTATANEGYHFTQWNDGNTDNPRTVVVTSDTTFTAQFVALVTLVTHVNNANMGSVSDGGSYLPGTSLTLTATANEGYHFIQWNDGNTDNPRTVVVNTDTSFTALFAANEYTVTLAVNDTAMGSTTGAGTYEYATQATIKALPAEGYHFDHWNDGITSALRRVTIICDTSFTAFFSANQYTLTVESNNDAMGSVTGGGSYEYNTMATLTASANPGYQFDHWSDNNTENPRTVTVTGDATYIANFSSTQGIEDAEADGVEVVVRNGRIMVSGAEGRSMVLTDALGRVLYRSTATETLTLDAPATGVYLLQVEGLPAQRVAVVK